MSDVPDSAGPGTPRRLLLGALLLVVVALILFVRPDTADDDAGADRAPDPTSAGGVMPSATPETPPSEEAFCREYRRMAASRSEYEVDSSAPGYDAFEAALGRLLATGLPQSMPAIARGGLYTEMSEAYGTLGLTLDPAAIPGGPEASGLERAGRQFTAYLEDYCPAW
jgi:hypothetical protein